MVLNKKWCLFVEEYLVDFNVMQVVICVGYVLKCVVEMGYELFCVFEVVEVIVQVMVEWLKCMEVFVDYVVCCLCEIDEMDVLDIYEDDGSFKFICEWFKVWCQFFFGIEVVELFEG